MPDSDRRAELLARLGRAADALGGHVRVSVSPRSGLAGLELAVSQLEVMANQSPARGVEARLEAALAERQAGLRGNPLVNAVETVREGLAEGADDLRRANIAIAILPPLTPPGGASGLPRPTLQQRMAAQARARTAAAEGETAARAAASRAFALEQSTTAHLFDTPQAAAAHAEVAAQRAFLLEMQGRGLQVVRQSNGTYRAVLQDPTTGAPLGPGSQIPQSALRPGEQVVPVPDGAWDAGAPPVSPSPLPFGAPVDPGNPGGLFGSALSSPNATAASPAAYIVPAQGGSGGGPHLSV